MTYHTGKSPQPPFAKGGAVATSPFSKGEKVAAGSLPRSVRGFAIAATALVLIGGWFILSQPATVHAQAPKSIVGSLEPNCRDLGNCDFCDALGLAYIITRFITGLAGGIALAYFMWFGFGYITSYGNTEKVQGAKKGLIATFFSLFVILGGWGLVNVLVIVLANPVEDYTKVGPNLFGTKPWNKVAGCENRYEGEKFKLPLDEKK